MFPFIIQTGYNFSMFSYILMICTKKISHTNKIIFCNKKQLFKIVGKYIILNYSTKTHLFYIMIVLN